MEGKPQGDGGRSVLPEALTLLAACLGQAEQHIARERHHAALAAGSRLDGVLVKLAALRSEVECLLGAEAGAAT